MDSPNFIHPSSATRDIPPFAPFDVTPASVTSGININSNSTQRFENPSVLRLMMWYHNGAQTKSINDLNVLVQNVIRAPDFKVEDFDNFDAGKAADKLFEEHEGGSNLQTPGPLNDGWYESAVPITLACDKVSHKSEEAAPTLNVSGLFTIRNLSTLSRLHSGNQTPNDFSSHRSKSTDYLSQMAHPSESTRSFTTQMRTSKSTASYGDKFMKTLLKRSSYR